MSALNQGGWVNTGIPVSKDNGRRMRQCVILQKKLRLKSYVLSLLIPVISANILTPKHFDLQPNTFECLFDSSRS